MRPYVSRFLIALAVATLLPACVSLSSKTVEAPPASPSAKPIIALVLGGGAAKGFAHIGVIKVLEAQGIVPDICLLYTSRCV